MPVSSDEKMLSETTANKSNRSLNWTGTGKSSLLSTYLGNDKPGPRDTTLGVDLGTQTMVRGNRVLKINVWDTTGDDNFRGLIAIYCRNTDAFVIVFDVTSRQSFWNAHTWAIFLVEHCADEGVPPMCLVGNKADRVVRVSLSLQCAACMSLC